MSTDRIDGLIAVYRDGLLGDVIPFWTRHGWDRESGGMMTCLDRDGSVYDTDKSVWFQGRAAWTYATLYHGAGRRPEWLEVARSCIEFLEAHGFDRDGRMFFHVTREGRPIRKRRYAYSESFACIAHAAYARAAGSDRSAARARELFLRFVDWNFTPGLMPPKFEETRPSVGMAPRMIALAAAQELRECLGDPSYDAWIDRMIGEIRRYFVKPDLRAVLETAGPDGAVQDHLDGRLLNPGHALEGAWFILREAEHRGGDRELVRLGCDMVDWMWDRGWDGEFGGLYYFRDLHGRPVQEYWHDMKFWWPHNEAVIATLLAYALTGEEKYARRHRLVHDWAHARFPDPEYGEWYGYLHRDGTPSNRAKGTLWKGPFHLPRMQYLCWKRLEAMKREGRAIPS